jgi:cytochrome c2
MNRKLGSDEPTTQTKSPQIAAESSIKKMWVRKFTLLSMGSLALIAVNAIVALPLTQVTVMPGSVREGERLLTDKGCLRCHAVDGRGGNRAPDFTRLSNKARTPALFASVMWNHSPRMWAEFATEGRPVPALTSTETADLFAFFYSTLYFSPQGDAIRGRNVFEEKGCVSCHSEILDTRSRKSILDWTDLKDPIAWAERMWNHASEMDSATTNRGIRWPNLSEQEMVDLLIFLSKLPETQTQMPSFRVGEPELGRAVFERSCETCHSFGRPNRSKVDLLAKTRPLSISGYIAAMWNHAPEMRRRAGATPKLNAGEMPHLIAFLFSQRYFLDRGNVSRGQRIFEEKGCATCHEKRRQEFGAPDLSQVTEVFSPITLTSAVWRHGPTMAERMKQIRVQWPEFTGSEMADLITYLNSKMVVRVAHNRASIEH